MNKIVIRIPNHLGDILMAKGAVKAFVEWTPDADVTLLMPGWAEDLYRDIEYIKFLPLKSNQLHGLGAIWYQVKLLSRKRFGIGVVLTPSFSSALVLSLAGIRSRYGYDGEGRGILLNNKIPHKNGRIIHRSQRYTSLLERVSGHRLQVGIPDLIPDRKLQQSATEILKENGVDPEKAFITIGPQSVAPSRTWDRENFRQLINKLDMPVILMGSADEFETSEYLANKCENSFNLCGQSDIGTASAIIGMSKLYIGNDSGLAHLAAAVGTPIVVLFGAGNPTETSPLTDKKTVIIKDDLECISCVKNDCRLTGKDFMQCMRLISVDEVFQAAYKTL
jgi:lipopolysaccharide heptosyltransferase II